MKWFIRKCEESYLFSLMLAAIGIFLMYLIARERII